MDIQAIFNRALETHHYNPSTYKSGMCHVLRMTSTREEFLFIEQHIDEYLNHLASLSGNKFFYSYLVRALEAVHIKNSFEDCLAIYKDWANRPMIRNQRI